MHPKILSCATNIFIGCTGVPAIQHVRIERISTYKYFWQTLTGCVDSYLWTNLFLFTMIGVLIGVLCHAWKRCLPPPQLPCWLMNGPGTVTRVYVTVINFYCEIELIKNTCSFKAELNFIWEMCTFVRSIVIRHRNPCAYLPYKKSYNLQTIKHLSNLNLKNYSAVCSIVVVFFPFRDLFKFILSDLNYSDKKAEVMLGAGESDLAAGDGTVH